MEALFVFSFYRREAKETDIQSGCWPVFTHSWELGPDSGSARLTSGAIPSLTAPGSLSFDPGTHLNR